VTRRGFGARIRERLERRRRRKPRAAQGPAHRERKVIEEIAEEFTTEELTEFLEGDLAPTEADPAFKERLRRELWQLVQDRYGEGRNED
jgi:hypothetical protein